MSRGGARGSKARKMERIIEELHPAQRDGLTVAGEDVGNMPASAPSTSDLIHHMSTEGIGRVGRMPAVQFVAESDPNEFWSLGDERVVAGADVTMKPDMVQAIQTGHLCLRCLEPHPDDPFPLACSLCGYSMKELQIRDFALEFRGDKHLGPSKPIEEVMDEMQLEMEKRAFARKIAQGKSPMKGLR